MMPQGTKIVTINAKIESKYVVPMKRKDRSGYSHPSSPASPSVLPGQSASQQVNKSQKGPAAVGVALRYIHILRALDVLKCAVLYGIHMEPHMGSHMERT